MSAGHTPGPFNVGDVVVCVDAHTPNRDGKTPTAIREKSIYRVSALTSNQWGDPGVRLRGHNSGPGFYAFRFQHLPKADEQFTEQMRAIKPIRKQVEA